VRRSLTPYFENKWPVVVADKIVDYLIYKYGFQWWLAPLPDSTEYVWMAAGYGGQNLQVFPEEGLIVTFTGWDILPSSTGIEPVPKDFLPLVKTKTCPDVPSDVAVK